MAVDQDTLIELNGSNVDKFLVAKTLYKILEEFNISKTAAARIFKKNKSALSRYQSTGIKPYSLEADMVYYLYNVYKLSLAAFNNNKEILSQFMHTKIEEFNLSLIHI